MLREVIGSAGRFAAVAVFLAFGVGAAPAAGATLLTVYRLPASLNYAEEIAAGPDGALWFTQDAVLGPRSQLVLGRITTAGAISSRALPPGARPISLAIGPDHALWYASWSLGTAARLGRITADEVRELPVPGLHLASAVLTGPDGALWFAADDRIGRLAADGSIATYRVPQSDGIEHIVSGPDGALWFADALRIGRVDTGGHMRFFRIPIDQSPEDIVTGPDGALWFSGDTCGCIGRMTTAGRVRIFRLPDGPDSPEALAAGADGAIWFTHSLGLGRITRTGEITDFALREPRRRQRFAQKLAAGPDGAMWFTLQDFNDATDDEDPVSSEIGRIDVAGDARRLLVARLADVRLRGRAGASMPVRFTSTRRAGGWLLIVRQNPGVLGWRTVTRARIHAGARTVSVRLPRRPGTYRAQLRLNVPSQDASDSALVRVSR
jgi:virginiamycin B lyase